MPKSHAPYPPEDRAEAIRLVRSSGQPVAQSARQVEVCSATLRLWVRQAAIDEGRRPDGPTTEQTEEVRRLHRAVKARREEREILFNL